MISILGRHLVGLNLTNKLLIPCSVYNHSKTCPTSKGARKVCPSSRKSGGPNKTDGALKGLGIKRASTPGLVRFGFIPEEWFLFFKSKTGVSGPYVFGIVLANYLLSKEIYILEHEYYIGLSIALVTYLVTTRMGPAFGASLDKEVDEIANGWVKRKQDELAGYENIIKTAKDAQWRAEGQQLLIEAKKENISMQLEAIYRERMMLVYRAVRGRMDYHLKKYRAEARIQQKWMIQWILKNVNQAITPDFQKKALDRAIQDLAAAAGRA